jgi:hypothetical protein
LSATPTALSADFEIEAGQFTDTGGCGDAFFWATNREGTAGITIEWRGAASQAWTNDGFTGSQQLPDPEITVAVVEGNGLSGYWCNDVRMPGQGVTSTIEASSGLVDITVRPTPGGFQPAGQADVRLSDIVFSVAPDDGETWHLDALVIENVSVGWMAG